MNKALEGQIRKYGSKEKFIQAMREYGKIGGSTKTENTKRRGFGSNPELARQMGLRKRGKTKKATL